MSILPAISCRTLMSSTLRPSMREDEALGDKCVQLAVLAFGIPFLPARLSTHRRRLLVAARGFLLVTRCMNIMKGVKKSWLKPESTIFISRRESSFCSGLRACENANGAFIRSPVGFAFSHPSSSGKSVWRSRKLTGSAGFGVQLAAAALRPSLPVPLAICSRPLAACAAPFSALLATCSSALAVCFAVSSACFCSELLQPAAAPIASANAWRDSLHRDLSRSPRDEPIIQRAIVQPPIVSYRPEMEGALLDCREAGAQRGAILRTIAHDAAMLRHACAATGDRVRDRRLTREGNRGGQPDDDRRGDLTCGG